jgi:hypothetical protein
MLEERIGRLSKNCRSMGQMAGIDRRETPTSRREVGVKFDRCEDQRPSAPQGYCVEADCCGWLAMY